MAADEARTSNVRLRRISPRRAGLIALAATAVLAPLTGDLFTAIGVVAATAMILIASRRYTPCSTRAQSRWRFVPLATAVLLLPLIPFTMGAAILLAPITVGLTITALRRVRTWRDPIVLVGVLANGLFALGFVGTLAIFAHEALK